MTLIRKSCTVQHAASIPLQVFLRTISLMEPTTLKVESVKKHEASLAHKSAQLKQNTADRPTETPAAKSLVSLNKIVVNRLKHLFRNAHALAKKGRPYADYEWMCNLDEAKGVDIGKTYRNRKVAAVFVECIAEVERHNLREKVLKSSFFVYYLRRNNR